MVRFLCLISFSHAALTLFYALADIAAMSVEEARRRYNTSRSDQRPGSASFKVLDCFGVRQKILRVAIADPSANVRLVLQNALDTVLTPEEQEKPFDTVSMQFCLHYAFENEFKARMMLDNVSKHLRYGGMFVGTIPDSEFILCAHELLGRVDLSHTDTDLHLYARREKLREIPSDSGPPYVFGNSRYNISFDHKPDVEITEEGDTIMEPFGTKYTFYLQDAVDHVPEYLVPWRQFEECVVGPVPRCFESSSTYLHRSCFLAAADSPKSTTWSWCTSPRSATCSTTKRKCRSLLI